MMNDRPEPRQPSDAGLCGSCHHGQPVSSARGSVFLLCRRSRVDPAYPRYPALPVVHCAGHEPRRLD